MSVGYESLGTKLSKYGHTIVWREILLCSVPPLTARVIDSTQLGILLQKQSQETDFVTHGEYKSFPHVGKPLQCNIRSICAISRPINLVTSGAVLITHPKFYTLCDVNFILNDERNGWCQKATT